MICAKVENGVVVNSALWEKCPDGWIDSDAGIGWTYDGSVFAPPEAPPTTTEQLQQQAKSTRDTAISAPILLPDTDALYQMDYAALANIERAKRKAERTNTTSAMWRLNDNTWRETTLDELNLLIELADERFEAVWLAFHEWDAGDKSEPFVVE